MKEMIKLSWKNLMLNKNRTITTLIMIIITVATFAGISIMYESAIKGLEQTFKETKGDYSISVENIDKNYDKNLLKDKNTEKVLEYYTVSKALSRGKILDDIEKEKGDAYLDNHSNEEIQEEIQKAMTKLKPSKWYIQKYELNKDGEDYNKQQEEAKQFEQAILNPYLGLDILGVNKEDLKGYNFRLIDGRLPENENEIVLQKASKTARYTFNIGTTITMNGKEYKIVGYVNNVFDSNDSEVNIGIVKIATEEEKKEAVSKIFGIYIKDKGKKVKDTAEEISKTVKEDSKNGSIKMAVNKSLLRLQNANLQGYESSTDNVIATLEMMRNVLIVIVAVSGIIIMYNSFNLSLIERRKQYGILKSLGIKNSSLYVMILFEALVLSVAGIVIGYICGMFGDYLVVGYINDTLVNMIKSMGVENELQMSLVYTTNIHAFYLVAISTGITVVLAAMIPAIKSTRISPIENIRGKDDYVVNTKKVKTSNISKKLFGIEFDLARKNMKRAKKRFRVATLSLAIAFILIFVIGTLGAQINGQISLLEVQTNSIFKNGNIVEMTHLNIVHKEGSVNKSDVKYSEKDVQEMIKFGIEDYTKQIESKDSLKVNRTVLASAIEHLEKVDNKGELLKTITDNYLKKNFKSSDDNSRQKAKTKILIQFVTSKNYNNKDKFGLDEIKDNEAYLSNVEVLEENGMLLEKPIFDESKIIGKEFEINGNKLKVAKAPVNTELKLTAGSSNVTYVQAYVNEKTFANIVRNEEHGMNFRGFYQSDLRGDKKIEDIMKKQQQENLEKEYDFGKLQMFTEGVLTPEGVIGMIKGMITIFQLLLYGFLILVILMSVVNIFTTITINILLRSRELAILKSVGMSDKQFDKMLRGENYIACLRSIIFGTVVSLLLLFATKLIIDKGNVNIDFRFIADMLGSINYIALAISIILVYGITFVSTFFAKRSIKSQDIVEVIRRDNI